MRVDHEELRAAFARAWVAILTVEAPADAIAMLLAQSSLETNRWAAVWNYSLAGIKSDGSGLHTYYTTTEVLPRAAAERALAASTTSAPCELAHDAGGPTMTVRVRPCHPWSRFRAYASLEDAAHDVVALLSRRYGAALDGARAGDPAAFVHALHAHGYFTASEADYLGVVQARFGEYRLPCLSSVDEITEALTAIGVLVGTNYDGAVQRFQADHGLTADGNVGPKTRALIRSLLPA